MLVGLLARVNHVVACFYGEKINNFVSYDQFMIVYSEAATRGILLKKVFLKIWQYLQENACVRIFRPPLLLKKDSNTTHLKKSSQSSVSTNKLL